MQPLKDSLECAVIAPVTKPLIHRRPRAKALWQVSPSCARAQDPEDAVEHQAIIAAGASHFLRGGNQIRDQLPSSIGKFVTNLAVCIPMKPAAPVTRYFIFHTHIERLISRFSTKSTPCA